MKYRNVKIIFNHYGDAGSGRINEVQLHGTTERQVLDLARELSKRTNVSFRPDTLNESFANFKTPWSIIGVYPYRHGKTTSRKEYILKVFNKIIK